MKKISFCIVLFNKSYSQSLTINFLTEQLKNKLFLGDVVIFNNGPNMIKYEGKTPFTVHQVLVNASLSKIYNKFISEYNSDYYVFLDDDTSLSEDYLNELYNTSFEILVPQIFCQGKKHYPVVTTNNKIQTITSGLAISSTCCNALTKKYGTVFDERFDLYGIDTALCYRINSDKLPFSISDKIIIHDLSHISSQDNSFREVEVLLANSAALIKYFNIRLLLQTLKGISIALIRMKVAVVFSSFISFSLKRVIRTWKY